MGKSTIGRSIFYTNMAILSAVLVSESLSATLMMPFVGLFVSHLQHIPPSEAGYMSGLLISVFQLGQVLTGKMWGTGSDRVGRKPMIQIGLLANAVVSIFFGMSPNLSFCVMMRFIHGCANGNVLVAKTVIADITDKETEGIGFAAISVFWGVGSIVGPAIGGYLYDPVHHAVLGPWLFAGVDENSENLFFDHPALLPCLLISLFSVLTLIIISWILPETSRRPIDPFMSLFSPFSSSASVRGTTNLKKAGSAPLTSAKGCASTDEFIAVVEEDEDNEYCSDDGDDLAYEDSHALSSNEGRKTAMAPNDRLQLTKHFFTSTSNLTASESLSKVIAAEMLAREYDRYLPLPGTGACVVRERHTSGLVSVASSTAARPPEPRRRRNDEAQQQQADMSLQVGDKRAAVMMHNATTVEDGSLNRTVEVSKLAMEISPRLVDSNDNDADDAPSNARSAPMVFGYREAFHVPSSRNVMVVYMCVASTESALLEIIPLWAISERENGGLGLSSADIGTLLCISSVVYVAVNVVFSQVLKCMSGATRPLWDFSVLLWCVTSILTPCCAYFADEKTIFYSASFITSVREIGLSWTYSILYMYVVRCAPDDCAGSINGIAQSIGSFSRMLTMLFIPPIFAWSLNGVTHPFPLNYHFVFWVTCVPLLLTFIMSSFLPIRVTG